MYKYHNPFQFPSILPSRLSSPTPLPSNQQTPLIPLQKRRTPSLNTRHTPRIPQRQRKPPRIPRLRPRSSRHRRGGRIGTRGCATPRCNGDGIRSTRPTRAVRPECRREFTALGGYGERITSVKCEVLCEVGGKDEFGNVFGDGETDGLG